MNDLPDESGRPDVPLTVRREDRDSCRVFTLDGDVDIETSRVLREQLMDGLTATDRVVVDFSDVGFMDSTGLGAVVGAWRVVRDDGAFVIAGARDVVVQVLSVAGLKKLFTLEDDVDRAVAAATA